MNRGPLPLPSWIVIIGLLGGAAAGGCGSKGLLPVAGHVTFAGQPPPGRGYVYFVPRDMSTNLKQDRSGPLPGTAVFAADGSFRAGTFKDGDGLRPGTYEVRLECSAEPSPRQVDMKTHDALAKSAIPAGFAAPDLVVPVSGGRSVRYDVDVR